MKNLPKIGERIIVYGMIHHHATVSLVIWNDFAFDWMIELDWGIHGKSNVKLHDENKTWYRFQDNN